MSKKQLFLSHNWGNDSLSRDNHRRVNQIKSILNKNFGWSTWFDEDDMGWNIDGSMLYGISECDVAVVCITAKYLSKIEENCVNPKNRDNCAKEWNLINIKKKCVIPVIMESELMSVNNWSTPLIGMYFGTHMLINLSDEITIDTVSKLDSWIKKNFNLFPGEHPQSICTQFNSHNISDNKCLKDKLIKNDTSCIPVVICRMRRASSPNIFRRLCQKQIKEIKLDYSQNVILT